MATEPVGTRQTAENVVIQDIRMSFGSMVIFMLKWTFASIPAAILIFIIFSIIGGVLVGMFGGMLQGLI